jgi:hypothetical protein
MLRSRMGFGALAIVIAGIAIFSSLFPALKVSAATPTPVGSSSASVSATFIDIAHISVVATGTYNGDDLSAYSGMFFNGDTANLYQGACTIGGCSGSGIGISSLSYKYTGAKLNHPGCGTSTITDLAGSPGNWTGTLTMYLPPSGTSNACQVFTQTNTPLLDQTLGSQVDIVDENDKVGTELAGAQSTTMYYMSSATTIDQASDDSYSGATTGAAYEYTNKGSTADKFYRDSMGSSACPDYIEVPSGTFGSQTTSVLASYVVQTSSGAGSCKAQSTSPVAVLAEKPSTVLAATNGNGAGGAANNGSSTAAPPDDCPIQNWALRWLVCPVLTIIDQVVSVINGYLATLLNIPTSWFDTTQNPGKAYFAAWGDFRDLAVSLIVIAALIMVIGESAGFDLLDAYSIRKILPRLLTGAIAMTLSWVICTFIIQLFNNLDNWVPDIILSPFNGLYNNGAALTPNGVLGTVETVGGVAASGAVIGGGVVAALALLQIPGIISLLISLFVAMIIAFVTLTIRTMIILLWLITSPLWMACNILPTTRRGYEFGRDAGTSAFVAGLAAVSFIAAGQLLAIVSITGKGVVPLLAPVAIVVSYMMIGNAFRVAGGLIGTAAGAVHGAHSGILNKQKEYRRGLPKKRMEQAESGFFKGALGRRYNDRIQKAALTPKAMSKLGVGQMFRPSKVKESLGTTHGAAEAEHAQHIKDDGDFKFSMNDDGFDKAVALTIGNDTEYGNGRDAVEKVLKEHYFGDANYDMDNLANFNGDANEQQRQKDVINQTATRAMAMKHKYADSKSLEIAATTANAGTGTGFKDTELDTKKAGDRELATKFMFARGDDGKLLHRSGKHFTVREELDDKGNAIPLQELDSTGKVVKNADGTDKLVYEQDENGKTLIDKETGKEIVATKKKVIIHDATAKMYKAINRAAGHDRGVAINMFAEMRGAANQSGRLDLGGAGFGDGANALLGLSDRTHAIEHSAMSAQEKKLALMDAEVKANYTALKSAADGNDAGVQSGGKPYSAEGMARTHFNEVQDQYERWQEAANNKNLPPAVVASEWRALAQRAAAAVNVYDSYRARSLQNAAGSANALTGNTVSVPEGSSVVGNLIPGGRTGTGEVLTGMQIFEKLQNDPAYRQIRQDIALQSGAGPELTDQQKKEALERQRADPTVPYQPPTI